MNQHLNKSEPRNLPAQTPFCIMYEGCGTWGFHLWWRKRWCVGVMDSSLLNKMSVKLVWQSQTIKFIIRQTLFRWSLKLTRPNASTTSNFENSDTFFFLFAWSVSIKRWNLGPLSCVSSCTVVFPKWLLKTKQYFVLCLKLRVLWY